MAAKGARRTTPGANSTHATATQRVAENVGHGRTPHANASTPGRLAAQRFRAQRDAQLRADNLRHARAARRTRPDNTFLMIATEGAIRHWLYSSLDNNS